MDKVWVLTNSSAYSSQVFGVFTTQEKARQAREYGGPGIISYQIIEYDLDTITQFKSIKEEVKF